MDLNRRTHPTLKERFEFALQAPCDFVLRLACASYTTFLGVFKLLPPSYMAWASRVKAPGVTQPIFRFDTARPAWTTLREESAFHLQLGVRFRI